MIRIKLFVGFLSFNGPKGSVAATSKDPAAGESLTTSWYVKCAFRSQVQLWQLRTVRNTSLAIQGQ